MLKSSRVDRAHLRRWAGEFDVADLVERALRAAGVDAPTERPPEA